MVYDSRSILLLSGDVELNPGPQCYSCGRNTQSNFLSCSCGNVSHKQEKCSGYTRTQVENFPWKCTICSISSCARDYYSPTIQSYPIFFSNYDYTSSYLPYSSASGFKSDLQSYNNQAELNLFCYSCSKQIKSNNDYLRCSCGKISHKQEKCSGYTRTQVENNSWKCTTCSIRSDSAKDDRPRGNLTVPESRTNLFCHSCLIQIKSNNDYLQCSCGKISHKQEKCSGYTRTQVENNPWKCPTCGNVSQPEICSTCNGKCSGYTSLQCCACKKFYHKQEKCSKFTTTALEKVKTGHFTCLDCIKRKHLSLQRSEIKPPNSRRIIQCMQWNANSVRASLVQMMNFLQKYNIDIALIQETKLTISDDTPNIGGYCSVRLDRQDGSSDGRGGGILIYIKNAIKFEEISKFNDNKLHPMQIITIKTILNGQNVFITNIYCPPYRNSRRSEDDPFNINLLPKDCQSSIIGGDFNAHSKLWDSKQPEDKRGKLVENWIIENNFECLNDSSVATRINLSTYNGSSPDITLCKMTTNSQWSCKDWRVMERIGSDHFPIIFNIIAN